MTDVGEEPATARVDPGQFLVHGTEVGGPIGDRRLEREPILRDAVLAATQSRGHAVEHDGQQAEFITSGRARAAIALRLLGRSAVLIALAISGSKLWMAV